MSGYLLETVGLKEALAGMERVERLDVQRDLKSVFNDLASTAVTNARTSTPKRSILRCPAASASRRPRSSPCWPTRGGASGSRRATRTGCVGACSTA